MEIAWEALEVFPYYECRSLINKPYHLMQWNRCVALYVKQMKEMQN